MEWNKLTDCRPEMGVYVLTFLKNQTNWISKSDPRYVVMCLTHNGIDYRWQTFGSDVFAFEQVSHWAYIEKVE